jgi:hypothetical protein
MGKIDRKRRIAARQTRFRLMAFEEYWNHPGMDAYENASELACNFHTMDFVLASFLAIVH